MGLCPDPGYLSCVRKKGTVGTEVAMNKHLSEFETIDDYQELHSLSKILHTIRQISFYPQIISMNPADCFPLVFYFDP